MKSLPQRANLGYQNGVSRFGLLMLFLLIGGFLTFGLKVGPIYIDYNVITGICRELLSSGEAEDMSTREIRERVGNALRINNISDFDLSSIRLQRESNRPLITIEYERRVELVGNLDIVAKFDHSLQ